VTGDRRRGHVRYGAGAVDHVPDLVAGRGARRVLLVCGRRSFEASGAARMLPGLTRVAEVRRWSGVAANPDAADIVDGLRVVAAFRPDLVLGVGGGSALDTAKLLCAYAGVTDGAELRRRIRAGGRVTTRGPALVLVPTTSGSGSEATHFAVVYLGAEKFSVAGPALRPDTAVLDPALAISGPPYLRASAGVDAVAQAVESLWAAGATDTSRRWARHALRLLLPAVAPFVAEPSGDTAAAMAIGSHLAGRAIDISKTTAAHALSYGITKRYGVSHGHAVALTLGAFLEAHDRPAPERLRPGVDPTVHAAVMAQLRERLGAADGPGLREAFGALLRSVGLATDLAAVGAVTPEDRAALAASVNAERLGNNPVTFSDLELARLLDLPDRARDPLN
jgi:alcohol dehydrogenase